MLRTEKEMKKLICVKSRNQPAIRAWEVGLLAGEGKILDKAIEEIMRDFIGECRCSASKCPAWRWNVRLGDNSADLGYCGLAGRPD